MIRFGFALCQSPTNTSSPLGPTVDLSSTGQLLLVVFVSLLVFLRSRSVLSSLFPFSLHAVL
jgi:hypothetical protein